MSNYTGLGSFVVGTNKYTYEMLPPIEAIPFGLEVAKMVLPMLDSLTTLTSNDSKAFVGALVKGIGNMDTAVGAKLMPTALNRCYTPENKPLSDRGTCDQWFQQHPDDLFEVCARAIYALSKDFFPSALASLKG